MRSDLAILTATYADACLALTDAAEANGKAQQALSQLPLWGQICQLRQQLQELEGLAQQTAVYQEARAAEEALPPLREAAESARRALLEARGDQPPGPDPSSE